MTDHQKLTALRNELSSSADLSKAKVLAGFFKTKKGEYGEGDVFLGVRVPDQRAIARRYRDLPLSSITKILTPLVR